MINGIFVNHSNNSFITLYSTQSIGLFTILKGSCGLVPRVTLKNNNRHFNNLY